MLPTYDTLTVHYHLTGSGVIKSFMVRILGIVIHARPAVRKAPFFTPKLLQSTHIILYIIHHHQRTALHYRILRLRLFTFNCIVWS